MYMGFLLKRSKDVLSGLSVEVKTAGGTIEAAAFIWLQIYSEFLNPSGWFIVSIGRGVIDVLGLYMCLCFGDICVICCGKKNFFLVRPLALVGLKYSLLVLCIHIVELSFRTPSGKS